MVSLSAWVIFVFKQKTAYEIPKRDWSSDVCSSDLLLIRFVLLMCRRFQRRGRGLSPQIGRPFRGGYSNPLTCPSSLYIVAVCRATFIGIDELKRCLYLRPGKHGSFFLLAFERLGKFIIPSSFAHELVPHVDFSLRRAVSHPKTRLQNGSIG